MATNQRQVRIDAASCCLWVVRAGLFLVLVATAGPSAAQGDFATLARHVPGGANALVLLNVDKVLESPVARQQGWRENLEKAHDSGLTTIPPKAARMITATQIEFDTMRPMWEMAVVDLNADPSMDAIARSQGGKPDPVDRLPAIVLPSNTYVVQFGPRTVGAMFPANRQNVARWVRESKAKSSATLSPYLTKAVGYADQVGTPIILAVDLTDVLPLEYVRTKIKTSQLYSKRSDIDVDELAQVISSVQGMTLGIVVGSRTYGQLKAEFATDASVMAGYAKLLLLEVLGNNGLMIDDFQGPDWKTEIKGNQISIKGFLSKEGLRQVLNVFQPPTVSAPSEPSDSESADPTDKAIYATQQYFQSITRTMDSLRNKKNVKTLAQYGTYFDNYARRIDRLPMLNVDSDMLNYGGYVSEQLRDAAVAVRGIAQNTRTRQVNRDSSPTYGGRHGYAGMFSAWVPPRYESQRERSRISAEERVEGSKSARAILQEVENATADVRRAMTKKYQAEF